MSNNDAIIMDLTRDVLELRNEVERLSRLVPLYDVKNVSLFAQLTADVNNYPLGDYDFIKLEPTANWTIYGFTNGTKGRTLWLKNASTTFNISFAHNSVADVGNRIGTGNAGTIVLPPLKSAVFIYDSDPLIFGTGVNIWFLVFPGA